jgi:DNA mismatch endonuclease, patch repair protein
MNDVFTRSKRSEVMSKIRGSGNRSTELALIGIFRESGITGWRRNHPLFGKPDFAFPEKRVVVFVDGCFWHGCPKHGNIPKNNREFWEKKIGGNIRRDRRVNRILRSAGWSVQRIWEHDIKKLEKCAGKILRAIGTDTETPPA